MSRKINYDSWSKEELIKELTRIKETKYGLVWHRDLPEEKIDILINPDARTPNEMFPNEIAGKPFPVLKEVKTKDIETDSKEPVNLLIQGDNYHSLAVLNFTHGESIDMIYIDPPYNTGNKDFIYNDQIVNVEDPFRHSKWLSFMEKRLKLAKNLLKSTGVIFISIDDNEQAQLKLLCDEIFGETSFVAMFPWKKRTAKSDVPFGVSQEYEWILCYAKKDFMAGVSFERKYYETPDYPNNKWRLSDLTTQKLEADRPNSAFDLIDPKTGKKYPYNPKRLWGITKDTFQQYYAKGKIVFPDDYDFLNISIPSYRVFESEDKEKALKKYGSEMAMKAVSTFLPKEVGMSEDGNKDMVDIFNERLFSYPKPVSLIKHLIGVSTKTDAVILDFFAGSGTTGQAVLQQNKEDDGHRQFILCTNNENNICTEVCYPRIKKIIKGYKNSKNENIEGLNGNLKYYMCSFVEAEPTDRNKRKLVSESTEMLCIKENTFQLVLDENDFKVFKNDSNKYLGIIFYEDAIDLYKKAIKKINGHFNTYVFSLGDDPHEKQFTDIKDKVTLCAIPEVILKVYREIFK